MPKALLPQRHSSRLRHYDYAQQGLYFITICTRGHSAWLSTLKGNESVANEIGKVVIDVWGDLPRRFNTVDVDAFVVMPNHIHGVLVVGAVENVEGDGIDAGDMADAMNRAPTRVGEIVRVFKAVSTRYIRQNYDPEFAWQRNYYEHIIRGEKDLQRVRQYIHENPARWACDRENPSNIGHR